MFASVSKSVRNLAMVSFFSGVSGCASDGGLGELAALGLLAGGVASGDTGILIAGVTAAAGIMIVAPLLAEDSKADATPSVSSASAAPLTPGATPILQPGTTPVRHAAMAKLIAMESVDKYKGRSCDYLLLSLDDANTMLTSPELQVAELGRSKKAVLAQILPSKNCPPLALSGGRLGAQIDKVDPVSAAQIGAPTNAVVVMGTVAGSNAQKAGLAQNDIVVEVNGHPVTDTVEFRLIVGQVPMGSSVMLKLWRASVFKEIPVLVGN